MVTYSLRRVCGGRTVTLVPQTAASRFLCKPYCDLTLFSTPQGNRKPCVFFNLTLNFFSETAMPQCCNHTARSPYGGHTVALRHSFYPVLGAQNSYGGLTAALRRPHSALMAAVQQTCNNREVAVRSPPGLLAVTLRFLISWIIQLLCGPRNICNHNCHSPQDLTVLKKKRFTNRRPQNRTATVRLQHDMWPRHKAIDNGEIFHVNSSAPGQNGCYFCRWHFQMHFLQWKWHNFNTNFIKIYSQESNWQLASIGSGNGLVTNSQ